MYRSIPDESDAEVNPWYLSRFIMRHMNKELQEEGAAEGSQHPQLLASLDKKMEEQVVTKESITDAGEEGPDLVIPLAAAGISFFIILALLATLIIMRRRKSDESVTSGSSIVVYPSQQGAAAPQFLTKEITFSLPTMRNATSMCDLEAHDGDSSDVELETDYLVPACFGPHSQRSNSFSSYGLGVIDPALYHGSLDPDEDLQFPEGHRGRIWFTLRYEPATEKLLVSLLKAKNLPSRTVGTVNSCDPYVRLHLIPDERRYLQTRQKKKTCNPYFDETFVFQISSKELPDHILKLSVIDAGRAKRRGVIGHVSVALRDLPEDVTSPEPALFKLDLEKEAQESICDLGELLVSLLYNENIHRLTVTVIEAKRIKFRKDERKDTYVRVTLNQHYRTVKIKRTATVRADNDTTNFSESFNFRVPTAQIDVTSVSFQVLHTVTGYGRDKLIGKFVLGSYMFARGKALTHWNSAFASPMEQIQHWHALCE